MKRMQLCESSGRLATSLGLWGTDWWPLLEFNNDQGPTTTNNDQQGHWVENCLSCLRNLLGWLVGRSGPWHRCPIGETPAPSFLRLTKGRESMTNCCIDNCLKFIRISIRKQLILTFPSWSFQGTISPKGSSPKTKPSRVDGCWWVLWPSRRWDRGSSRMALPNADFARGETSAQHTLPAPQCSSRASGLTTMAGHTHAPQVLGGLEAAAIVLKIHDLEVTADPFLSELVELGSLKQVATNAGKFNVKMMGWLVLMMSTFQTTIIHCQCKLWHSINFHKPIMCSSQWMHPKKCNHSYEIRISYPASNQSYPSYSPTSSQGPCVLMSSPSNVHAKLQTWQCLQWRMLHPPVFL